ncbi:hypothetical protein CDD82_6507 [Ophiocordyceps australis]|uniref:Neprosin PEP catalytic domain-containing protein n=1 Tax=Ophiocordyceps australis TaxID=1399860 RepID=A0A2C5YUK2_9HYPO|nr:hypothetical protein CDD82_6507 [Ophiocordyceps australis]
MKYSLALAALSLATASPFSHPQETTTDSPGRTIICVPPESQGSNKPLAPKPPPPSSSINKTLSALKPPCPRGTVPRLQPAYASSRFNSLLQRAQLVSQGVAQHAGATTFAGVSNHGGGGTFLAIKPHMPANSAGTSVLQMALSHAAGTANNRQQTVEAGITMMPQQFPVPVLFTYFTTVAHASDADAVGGYNSDQQGWIQVDDAIYPGIEADAIAKDDEISINYVLDQGNWWLWAQDRYLGYYPGSLFAGSLNTGAEQISLFGEVFDRGGVATGIPMGTGVAPTPSQNEQEPTCNKAAYIRNAFYIDTQHQRLDFDGAPVVNDQPQLYGVQTHFKSPTPWKSYICLGGGGGGGGNN